MTTAGVAGIVVVLTLLWSCGVYGELYRQRLLLQRLSAALLPDDDGPRPTHTDGDA